VTEENHESLWDLFKMKNGDVHDWRGRYGGKDVVYGRLVGGLLVPVKFAVE